MSAKSFSHEELFVTSFEGANELRLGVIIKMSAEVVDA
jgi:hypothetical protein